LLLLVEKTFGKIVPFSRLHCSVAV
jgi:hypothetical protein